jgi:site-specific recombinase XerD
VLPQHVQDFVLSCQEQGYKPATIAIRIRGLQAFYHWALEEGEISKSPCERLTTVSVPETYVSVPTDETISKLLATCEGRGKTSFKDRRDAAILRLLVSTGIRRSELAGLQVTDIDLDQQLVVIHGNGSKVRVVYLTDKTSQALDRYTRVRSKHIGAQSPTLFLGHGGPARHFAMTDAGVYYVLQHRAKEAGIEHLHPHQLRHRFADRWLSRDGLEGDLIQNMGWSVRSGMIRHNAAERASARARESAKRLSIGDEF